MNEVELPFRISGVTEVAREFELEVLQRRSSETKVSLEVPSAIAGQLDIAEFQLPSRPRLSLGRVRLTYRPRHQCSFRVMNASAGDEIAIRQLYRGEELGRVTFRFQS